MVQQKRFNRKRNSGLWHGAPRGADNTPEFGRQLVMKAVFIDKAACAGAKHVMDVIRSRDEEALVLSSR